MSPKMRQKKSTCLSMLTCLHKLADMSTPCYFVQCICLCVNTHLSIIWNLFNTSTGVGVIWQLVRNFEGLMLMQL